MKKSAFAILMLAITTTDALAGWRFGNGGDGMRLAFLKAKEHAAHITSRLNERAINRIQDPDVRVWLAENRMALSADILGSAHQWYTDEKPTCAWTNDPANPSVIHLSFARCEKTIDNFEEAGQLLIHEATHHLGVQDESLADRIALEVYKAWQSGATEWQPTAISSAAPNAVKFAAMEYVDDGVVVQGGLLSSDRTTSSAHKYVVNEDRWVALNSNGAPATFAAQTVWTGDKLIVWGGYKRRGGVSVWQNSGAIWDKKTERWSAVTCRFGPDELADAARYEGAPIQTVVWTGSEVIVFGGALVGGKAPGGMFDPNADSHNCRQMTATSYPRANVAHAAVWANNHMLVYGGNENRAVSANLASFDPKANRWTSLASSAAPEARDGHTAVWTGSKMIVYGGRGNSMRTLTMEGGVYDPLAGWSTFNSDTIFGRHGHTAVWSGNEMIVFGGKPTWTSGIGQYLNSVYALNPVSMTWRVIESKTAPAPRQNHSAAWTGSSLVVFGGQIDTDRLTATGGVFYP